MTDLADYRWLTSSDAARWLAEVATSDEPPHRLQRHLRKHLSAERARLVELQCSLRRKAAEKFGPLAARMFFTDLALQQATDLWINRRNGVS